MNVPTHVAIAVVKHQSRWLVGRRPAGRHFGGYWEFPGGKVRPAELPALAARRECHEESGVIIEVDEPLDEFVHRYDYATLKLTFFLCHPIAPEPQPEKPFRFVTIQQLRDLQFPPANDGVLRRILDSFG